MMISVIISFVSCAGSSAGEVLQIEKPVLISPENNRVRQRIVLRNLLEQEKITKEAYELALEEDIYSKINQVNEDLYTPSENTYFVDEVINRVIEDLEIELGYTNAQATNLLYKGGLQIYVTQDDDMQSVVDKEFNDPNNFPSGDNHKVKLVYTGVISKNGASTPKFISEIFETEEVAFNYIRTKMEEWINNDYTLDNERIQLTPEPQAAMIIIDYYTGHVKAIAGGRGEKHPVDH
jgi:penicillin-binding protein 1A